MFRVEARKRLPSAKSVLLGGGRASRKGEFLPVAVDHQLGDRRVVADGSGHDVGARGVQGPVETPLRQQVGGHAHPPGTPGPGRAHRVTDAGARTREVGGRNSAPQTRLEQASDGLDLLQRRRLT